MAQTEESMLSEDGNQLHTQNSEALNTVSNNDGFGLTKEKKPVDFEVPLCRNFANDRCTRGVTCKFRHEKLDGDKSYERSRSPMSKDEENRSNTCRDFLRNMCNRGKNCRYFHPEEGEYERRSWFVTCLDFQNGKCGRHDCRYFHVSVEDETLFKETGEISFRIIEQAMQKAVLLDMATSKSTRPTCKDYLQGVCEMRACRYRHVERSEYEAEVFESLRDELVQKYGPSNNNGNTYSQGNFDMYQGRGGGMGPTSFSEGYRGPPEPMMVRDGYPPLPPDPYPYDRRGVADYHVRPPAEVVPYPRQPEMDPYHQHSAVTPGMYPVTTEKNVMNVEIEESRDLPAEVARLQKANEELQRDLNSSKHWEQIYSDTKAKLQSVQTQNQEFVDKVEAQTKQILALESKIQTSESYKTFVKDQAYKLEKQMLVVETELAQSWGGGPPPLSSQRAAWRYLKSLLVAFVPPLPPTTDDRAAGAAGGRSSYPDAGEEFPSSYSTGGTFDAGTEGDNYNYSQSSQSEPGGYAQRRMDSSAW